MDFLTRTGKPLPKAIVESAKTVGDDAVSRREFLATASTFGATAAVAYGMLGMLHQRRHMRVVTKWAAKSASSKKFAP